MSYMDCLDKDEFGSKLICILRKITECKSFEGTFIDKFLANIDNEFSNRQYNIPISELHEWLFEIFHTWRQSCPVVSEAVFICEFIGILSKNEQGFYHLQNINALNELCTILETIVFEKRDLISAYIKLLSDVLSHSPGYEWIKTSQSWKHVCSLYFSNSNLFVEREGQNFIKKLIHKAALNEEITEEILREIFLPVRKYNEMNTTDKKFYSYTLLLLRLLESLLKMNIFQENLLFCSKLQEVFDIESFLNFLLVNCQEESLLVSASILKILYFVAKYENKEDLLVSVDIAPILDTYYAMLKQNQFTGILKLAKYCQVLWNKMELHIKCGNTCGVNFIVVQLLPVLLCIKPPDTALCDLYIQKLFSLTTDGIQKFCYLLRDEIRSQISSTPKDLALKGVLSVLTNTECLNLEQAVIIFQAMAYTLKTFVGNSCQVESVDCNKSEKEQSLCIQDTHLLSAVLNALCVFIEKFKINWPESLESLSLLKLTCILLQNSGLSSIVVVQVFLLVKLTILNFMSPDLALLLNNTKDSTFDCLVPLLHKRLHDPKWEIRDSCLEVITAIAELSESKYPAFQQPLVENNFFSLVVDIMEGDSESYVRASAVQALTAMMKIESLNQFPLRTEFQLKIIKLLQKESEGIVRREAVLLIKQIYLALGDPQGEMANSLYEIMGYLAICDLHWEVKVNSLVFWEAVIQRTMADQGMIDGSFPKVTFSKEHKKIVNLTEEEVKLRLDKVLLTLSKIGCLYVLMTTLNDDCDMPVIKKSAQILWDLITILKNYGAMGCNNAAPVCDRVSMKRKSVISNECEKRKTLNLCTRKNSSEVLNEKVPEAINNRDSGNSDEVINGIVNETDINLLVRVSAPNEEAFSPQKKIILQKIKPEAFIFEIQNFDLIKFLEEKQKWLQNMEEIDVKSLVSKTSVVNFVKETNVMDCY